VILKTAPLSESIRSKTRTNRVHSQKSVPLLERKRDKLKATDVTIFFSEKSLVKGVHDYIHSLFVRRTDPHSANNRSDSI